MSQFRIKNIDKAIPDEWVYKINDGVSVTGDDIDARDPNELADSILDTQTILLKTSTLPSDSILKPNSGIAERITILEAIAGNSSLQDIYANGSTISVLSGQPLTFGIREEIKLDDAGNLSFKPVTMKIKGQGFATLDLSNMSITTNLGDLLVGATSPGSKLTLRAENHVYFKDIFLSNPVTLSEPGNSFLVTTSQSLVGAINELKSSAFNTSLQAVYGQSSPPKLTTNITQGAVIIEDPNSTSVADALRIIGILNVTKKAKVGDLKVGLNTTIADTAGYITSDPIKTSNKLETPYISSGTSELTIQDKRVSFPFSDTSVTGLLTNKKSLIGAINELKTDIQTVGGAATLFNVQHDSSNGFHKIITTQAEVGANTTKRFIVRNQTGAETLSINGNGDIVANTMNLAGLSVGNLLSNLVDHINNDGTAHSAVASHLIASNPHNTVKSILGLAGVVNMASTDGVIDITTSGNTVNLKFNNRITMQEVYNNLLAKEIKLDSTGLTFKDNLDAPILKLGSVNIVSQKNLLFQMATGVIGSTGTLRLEPTGLLYLSSTTEDVRIETTAADKKVLIQNVSFSEAGASTLPSGLGTSVLGAFKKLNDNIEIRAINKANNSIDFQSAFFIDSTNGAWPHIPDFHPANEFISGVDFFWENKGALYFPQETIASGEEGKFFSSGTHNITASKDSVLPSNFHKGAKLYPLSLSYADLSITSIASLDNYEQIIIGGTSLTAKNDDSQIPENGDFAIDDSTNLELRADYTRDNIINTLNNAGFNDNFNISVKAGVWGEASKGYITIAGTIPDGATFQIKSEAALDEGAIVTFTASNTPSGLYQFLSSANKEAVAYSLANAINQTTFRSSGTGETGHKCRAKVNGSVIEIEWYKPGLTGKLVLFDGSTIGTGAITTTIMSGGTCQLRIYDMNITDNELSISENAGGLSILTGATFIPREKENDYFQTASQALSAYRYMPHYVSRELGSIEAVQGNIITLKIKG